MDQNRIKDKNNNRARWYKHQITQKCLAIIYHNICSEQKFMKTQIIFCTLNKLRKDLGSRFEAFFLILKWSLVFTSFLGTPSNVREILAGNFEIVLYAIKCNMLLAKEKK